MFRYLFISFLIIRGACFGQIHDLSTEQKAVLAVFVETFLKDTEAGYVLHNQKPVCGETYFSRDPLPINSDAHKQSTAFRAGARIWKELVDLPSDTIIHVCENEDPQLPRHIHLLAINIPLFHQVVNENLPLFQYVLGPAVSSQGLLDALLSNRQTLYSLLKGDKVLIGIILGYGKQNALYISRMENIQEALDEDTPPFLGNAFIQPESSEEYLPFAPTFGFKSVTAEMNTIERQTVTSSLKLSTKSPKFIFGWIKDSKSSQEFISNLEASQDLINVSFLSPLSLEQVLKKFGKKITSPIKALILLRFLLTLMN